MIYPLNNNHQRRKESTNKVKSSISYTENQTLGGYCKKFLKLKERLYGFVTSSWSCHEACLMVTPRPTFQVTPIPGTLLALSQNVLICTHTHTHIVHPSLAEAWEAISYLERREKSKLTELQRSFQGSLSHCSRVSGFLLRCNWKHSRPLSSVH